MSAYSVLFLSTAEISIPLLEKLSHDDRFEVIGLICQPDRPAGREMALKRPETKVVAEQLKIPVFQPEKLSSDTELLNRFKTNPPDFLLTFAYGQILNEDWLQLPKIAPLNVHGSLLPKHRGASPIQASILSGDTKTGISVMKMVKAMDAGPVAFMHEIPLHTTYTAGLLHDDLADLAAKHMPDDMLKISNGDISFTEQNHDEATYCKKISKKEGFIDFKESAENILRKFHAYTPWPGLWTNYLGKRLKMVDISLSKEVLSPGEIRCHPKEVLIGTSDGSLLLKQLQMEGKQCMHSDKFILGQSEFCSASLPS